LEAHAEAELALGVGVGRVADIRAECGAGDAELKHVRDEMSAVVDVISGAAILAADLLDGLLEIGLEIDCTGALGGQGRCWNRLWLRRHGGLHWSARVHDCGTRREPAPSCECRVLLSQCASLAPL